MNTPALPPDDCSPVPTALDRVLQLRLQDQVSTHFYEACDRITQALLAHCPWRITNRTGRLTLEIPCPDLETYWHILSNLEPIGDRLGRFARDAQIRVLPPVGKGAPLEIGIDELSS